MLDALKRLEYRGYDSAGIAVMTPIWRSTRRRARSRNWRRSCPRSRATWASATPAGRHAESRRTRTPTRSATARKGIAVVHNGIIENYMSLRKTLEGEGHKFSSQTDTEVIVHLLEKYYVNDMHEALQKTVADRYAGRTP